MQKKYTNQQAQNAVSPPLSGSEAVFGFAAWLTSQPVPVIASARHDAGVWAKLVQQFCDAQGLAEPRNGWQILLKDSGGVRD